MYKPTFYITMESDPAHYNPQGEGLAMRLWSFAAPTSFAPSPSGELGIRCRMKCSKPYWNAADETEQANWETVARPFLKDKAAAIIDVLGGINDKHYQHYEGSLHFTWLKLALAPYEIRIRLDADAEDHDFLPDVMGWLDRVRELLNSPECKAFEAENAEDIAGAPALTVFVPSRAEAEALRTKRAEEAKAFAAWEALNAAAEVSGAEVAETAETATAEAEVAKAAAAETEAAEAAKAPVAAEKPELSGALEIKTLEFIAHDGNSLLFDVETSTWRAGGSAQ